MDDLNHGIDGVFALEPEDLIFLKVSAPACDVLSLSEGKKLSTIAPEHCLEVGLAVGSGLVFPIAEPSHLPA